MKKINKYDLIIFSCLFLAIICLVIGIKDYMVNLEEKSNIKNELTSALNSINSNDNEEVIKNEKEPSNIKEVDKKTLINNYLDAIKSQIVINNDIDYKMINSWGNYSIDNIIYIREVTDDYYQYNIQIKTTTKEIIDANVYIYYASNQNSYTIKLIELQKS